MGSYNTVEYRLIQQEDSDCEGDLTPLRTRRRTDKMNLSVHNRPLLLAAYLAVSLIGVTFVITTIVWAAVFKNGIKFSTTELGIDFNWHPILMTISLLFLYGNGALIYRVIPAKNDGRKLKLKIGHALTMMAAFALMVIGLQAAFDSHNLARDKENKPAPKPNMYTLHSWVGILAATLFGCQWLLGFLAVLAAAAALLGHLEKSIWSNKEYSKYNPEAVLVNITGILIVLFVMGVTSILSKFSTEHPNKDKY